MGTAAPGANDHGNDLDGMESITIVVGPLGRDNGDRKIADAAERAGRSAEDLSLDVVRKLFRSLTEQNDNGSTRLDELFSAVLGGPVSVNEYYEGYEHRQGVKYPAFVIKIPHISGDVATIAGLRTEKLRDALTGAFGLLFGANWMQIFISSRLQE